MKPSEVCKAAGLQSLAEPKKEHMMYDKTALPLADYIEKEWNGSQANFAKANGVQPAQVTQWLKKDFIVVDHKLYSHRRDLNPF